MDRSSCSPRTRRRRGLLVALLALTSVAAPTNAAAQEPPAPPAPPASPAALPDEGYVAPPPVEYEHDSLTLDAPQRDRPSAGREYVLGAVDEPADGAVAVAGAVEAPGGLLPLTGAGTTTVLLGGLALLWAGVAAYALAWRSSRGTRAARP